jgi:hypothetical protein
MPARKSASLLGFSQTSSNPRIYLIKIYPDFIFLFCPTQLKTRKLLQICKQVATRLLSIRRQDVFALLVPSCCDKSGTSC